MPAPDPNAPPESVILQQFTGLKNTVSPERLLATELEIAINADIDDTGQLRRRRGFTKRDSANFRSLYDGTPGKVFGVRDNVLGIIRPDYSFFSLTSVSDERVSYDTIGPDTYFSSRTHSGIIDGQDNVNPWGTVEDALWVSPVINPTATMGAISGKLLGPPPLAHDIAYYRGRMYLADDRMLWATEPFLYGLVDKTRTFFQFEDNITMLAAMDDGLYVGTEAGLYFMQGATLPELKRSIINSDKVYPGSAVWVPTEQVHPDARKGAMPSNQSVVFMTSGGIMAGMDGGQCYNMTQGGMVFPDAISAAGLFREDSGVSTYVAVTDSGGGPSANARIGDFVDAEIRRFQG